MIRASLGALALLFALTHVPLLVSSLEDIDSVNFALGVREFDVAAHRPHPPGYPVYIALGKGAAAVARAAAPGASPSTIDARALSALSVLAALVAIVLLYRVLSCFAGPAGDEAADLQGAPWRRFEPRAMAATALTVACPLFWYLGVRPMSDLPGLAAALAAQAALALAWWRQQPDAAGGRRLLPDRLTASGRMIVVGSLLAGLSIGFRSQNAMLTLPLLAGVLADRIGRGVAGALLGSGVALGVGVLLWAVPLVVASGGIDAYLAALGSQAGEDFTSGEMLSQNPTPRLAAYALMRTFIYPWDSIALGGIVVAAALLGTVALLVRDRRALMAVALLVVPYLAFHLLFQDTSFVRYALPLVPAVAWLGVSGLEWVLGRAAWPAVAALSLWAIGVGAPVLAAYAREPSPATRVAAAMQAALPEAPRAPGALAFHQTFRRPLEAEAVAIAPTLPSPPYREWLELVEYWQAGRVEPIWFLADPRRTDLALVDPRSRADRTDFRWQFSSLSDLGGMRPAAVTWHRMPAPGWFAAEGWALTPETAGIARLMGRGPSLGPITAWVRRRPDGVRVLIGGRHLGAPADPPASFALAIDNRAVAAWQSGPGFFLRLFDLPPTTLSGDGPLARLTVQSTVPGGLAIPTAIEQFDLQTSGSLMWAFGEGWHEAEYQPSLGLWRWTSDRSILRIVDARTPVAITLRVERPGRYFDDDPLVRMTAGERVLGETRFRDSDVWRVIVPFDALEAAGGTVTIETTATFVPADRGTAGDRRRLGLRVFGVDVAAQP